MDKYKKYDVIVSCLFQTLSELKEKNEEMAIAHLDLSHKCDRAILEVAHMVQSLSSTDPIYLEMGPLEFLKNKLLKRFKKFNVKRTKKYLPTANMRSGIIYQTSLKYCSQVMKNKEKFMGDRNFLIYSQIEEYLDEIYDEYYNPKKR